MKIIIVGAAIAGLSSYIFLHKHLVRDHPHDYELKIYEAYDIKQMQYDAPGREQLQSPESETLFTPKIIGNAIGLGKNGLAVLKRMDDDGDVLRQIQEKGNCVSKWRIMTARGWSIVDANVQASNGDNAEGKTTDTVMIARQVAWEVLRDHVLSINPDAVTKKKVSSIADSPDGKVILHFTDNTKDSADLLIGADGLHSIVRQTIFKDTKDFEPQSWLQWPERQPPKKKDYITPQYEGLTGLGGFIPASVLAKTDYDPIAMSITFGPNGFFGHGYIGPVTHGASDNVSTGPIAAWWSTFSSDSPRPYQAQDQTRTRQDTRATESTPNSQSTSTLKTTNKSHALTDLLHRHRSWVNPTIHAILDYIEENESIEHMYPTYTTPELPTWVSHGSNGKTNMVLVGDAAHALQPSSGQGACQALEDAEALALFLRHYLAPSAPTRDLNAAEVQTPATQKALSAYVSFRKPRVAMIYKQSQRMSGRKMDMGVLMEYVMYAAIWIGTKMGGWGRYNEALFGYDLPGEVERVLRGEGRGGIRDGCWRMGGQRAVGMVVGWCEHVGGVGVTVRTLYGVIDG
ncbi:hypothetical protein OHC33_010147 [Knufia fluminis]|uniref:FAD-binding domain-containing protein n=1 Tax=Knufia fluminis TaxID=191047 RepID=A0AAN8EZ90_9EURO|nr:hypothetical protein OHC33_010147 [Knufia fluminis]